MTLFKRKGPSNTSDFEKTFRSAHVATIAGVTLRQLQWWDERGVIMPHHVGHTREYTGDQLMLVCVLSELRKRGYSLQNIRKLRTRLVNLMQEAKRDFPKEMYLLTDGRKIRLGDRFEALAEFNRPVSCIYLSPILSLLKAAA